MLIEFTVGNYRSFKEPQTLSFEATSLTEYAGNVVKTPEINLLKSVALYGPNGSGKSNFLQALNDMVSIITNSLKLNSEEPIGVVPFQLDRESASQPSTFEVLFYSNGSYYTYGFEATNQEIVTEHLYEGLDTDRIIFERGPGTALVVSEELNEANALFKFTLKNRLFLAILDSFNIEYTKHIRAFFNRIAFVQGLNPSKQGPGRFSRQMLSNPESKAQLIAILKSFDIDVEDIIEQKVPVIIPDELKNKLRMLDIQADTSEISQLLFIHNKYGEHGEVIGQQAMPLDSSESHGTINLFSIAGLISHVLNAGDILVFDELEASLHPFQTLNIISLFNEHKGHAQLLFSTHDTMLLKRGKLRRDQVYFIEKTRHERSKIYALAEIQGKDGKVIRKDYAFEDGYLRGRFGAIPRVQTTWPDIKQENAGL